MKIMGSLYKFSFFIETTVLAPKATNKQYEDLPSCIVIPGHYKKNYIPYMSFSEIKKRINRKIQFTTFPPPPARAS